MNRRVSSKSSSHVPLRGSAMAIENMDEILTMRSQASDGDNSMGSSSIDISRRFSFKSNTVEIGTDRSRNRGRSEVNELDQKVAQKNAKNSSHKYFRDTSSVVGGFSGAMSGSESSDSLELLVQDKSAIETLEKTPMVGTQSGRRSTQVQSANPTILTTSSRFKFLSCLGCFGQTTVRMSGERDLRLQEDSETFLSEKKMIDPVPVSSSSGPSTPPAAVVSSVFTTSREISFENPTYSLIHRLVMTLSEQCEVSVYAGDSRLIFLLFSALSGEPLLGPEEYSACDEWCDWLALGYSGSGLENFERDMNRTGSQSLGLLFQLFFALEFTATARLCSKVIKNVHFEPSSLFGLFAVNCAKWTRDVLVNSMDGVADDPPKKDTFNTSSQKLFIQTSNGCFAAFPRYLSLIDWWVSEGLMGSIEPLEEPFADVPVANLIVEGGEGASKKTTTGNTRLYESFVDVLEEEVDGDSDDGPPDENISKRNVDCSPKSEAGRANSRLPLLDISHQEDLDLIKRILVAGGVYYVYCMLSFAKFWIDQDLTTVDAEVARDRLNNLYLQKEFVSKLTLSHNSRQLRRRIKKLEEKIIVSMKQKGID